MKSKRISSAAKRKLLELDSDEVKDDSQAVQKKEYPIVPLNVERIRSRQKKFKDEKKIHQVAVKETISQELQLFNETFKDRYLPNASTEEFKNIVKIPFLAIKDGFIDALVAQRISLEEKYERRGIQDHDENRKNKQRIKILSSENMEMIKEINGLESAINDLKAEQEAFEEKSDIKNDPRSINDFKVENEASKAVYHNIILEHMKCQMAVQKNTILRLREEQMEIKEQKRQIFDNQIATLFGKPMGIPKLLAALSK